MATPVLNDLKLPERTLLVLLDNGSETTGVIFRSTCGHFMANVDGSTGPTAEHTHVLFSKEMVTAVEIDSIEYMAMNQFAVVGLIPG